MNTNWTTKDRLWLLVIPIELLISVLIFKVFFRHLGPNMVLIINLVIFGLGFCIMLYLFGSVLKAQFHQYRKRLWLKLLLNIGLTLGAYGALSFTRGLMGTSLEANPLESITYGSLFVMIAASIQPLLAPFAEELTFRYLLFMKIKPGVLKLIVFLFLLFYLGWFIILILMVQWSILYPIWSLELILHWSAIFSKISGVRFLPIFSLMQRIVFFQRSCYCLLN